ncbi:MAG: transcription elongation factor GreA [Clostridia bacterium]|nr:transcription elongation factor GreA [Clostridia bacterium]
MATKAKQLYTETGYRALVEELDYLKNTRRAEVKEAIAVARSFGDLSENAEYDAARNEQAQVEARILELEDLISNAEIVDESAIKHDSVNVGSTVKVFDVEYDEEIEYSIVGSNEANPLLGKISDQSPVGQALIGAKVGDEVVADAPGGQLRLRVLEVSRTKTN